MTTMSELVQTPTDARLRTGQPQKKSRFLLCTYKNAWTEDAFFSQTQPKIIEFPYFAVIDIWKKSLWLLKTKQAAPKGHLFFLLLFFENKRCMHNVIGSWKEILPKSHPVWYSMVNYLRMKFEEFWFFIVCHLFLNCSGHFLLSLQMA